jgi:hypothetical protein
MKMTMKFATGVIAKGMTEDGKEVQLRSVELAPFFLTPKGQSELLSVKSESDQGLDIEELAFLVSGSSGKLTKKDRSFVAESVVADIDKKQGPETPLDRTPLSELDEDEEEEDEFAEES